MPTDRFTVRAIAVGLLIVALAVVAAMVLLMIFADLSGEQQTAALTTLGTLGTTAAGATAAMLARTSSEEPAPVDAPPMVG